MIGLSVIDMHLDAQTPDGKTDTLFDLFNNILMTFGVRSIEFALPFGQYACFCLGWVVVHPCVRVCPVDAGCLSVPGTLSVSGD